MQCYKWSELSMNSLGNASSCEGMDINDQMKPGRGMEMDENDWNMEYIWEREKKFL